MKTWYVLIPAFLVFHIASVAQNLTGVWEGSVGGNYCKIVILQIKDSCFGYTYDTDMGYCKANFTGAYNDSLKKLNGKNTSFIEKTPLHSLSVYHLTYSKHNDEEYLQGRAVAKTTGAKLMSFGLPIPITYRKISGQIDTTKLMAVKIDFYKNNNDEITKEEKKIIVKADPIKDSFEIKSAEPLLSLKTTKESRVSKLIQTIETGADSIKLILYDDGEIDGDTVTVFDNGSIIIANLALSLKPYEIIIPVNKNNPLHAIELMANNLGTIPPNTAYMLILAGKERYELRAASDFSVNAQVNIKFKEVNK